jgi:hypothetical protein
MFHEAGGTGHLTRPGWNPGPTGQPFTLSMRVPTLTSLCPLSLAPGGTRGGHHRAPQHQDDVGGSGRAAPGVKVAERPARTTTNSTTAQSLKLLLPHSTRPAHVPPGRRDWSLDAP